MQILESGEPISNFRNLLNDRARKHDIRPARQRLIEANTLHPLRIQHFLILPAILVAPIAALLALPIFGVTLAVLLLIEFVLINFGNFTECCRTFANFLKGSLHLDIFEYVREIPI